METDPYLQSISSIPLDYYQCDPLFSTNYNDAISHDDACMDDIFMGLEEAHFPSIHDVLINDSRQQQEPNIADLLLMSAEAIESENGFLASNLIVKLEQLFFNIENEPSPFMRLAQLFTMGLRSRDSENQPIRPPPQAPPSTVEDMSAYQMVQELTPFVKFAHFSANQAILEATNSDLDVHIVDFDVMDGIQWPPLMVDLVNRSTRVSLRITAAVTDTNMDMVSQTGRRLIEFADSIGLMLRFDHIELKDLEVIQVNKGSVIANCMLQQSQMSSKSLALLRVFLSNVRKLSPKLVVLVKDELLNATKSSPMPFVEFFCEAMHHFSSMFDAMACSFYGGYKIGLRLAEKEILGPRIIDYVSQFPFGSLGIEGFKLSPLSACNVSQAKYLLGLFNRGFSVQHDNGRLALCWKSRPLLEVSIWVPT